MNEDSSFHLNAPDNAVVKSAVFVLLEYGTPISVEIEGMSRSLILDTGSNVSILQLGVSRGDVRVTTMEPYGVTGEFLNIKGQQSVSFKLNGCEFKHTFLISSLPTDVAGLVGTDFMASLGAVIYFERVKLLLTGNRKVPRVYSVPPTGHKALTIFSVGKADRNPQLRQQESRRRDMQVTASLSPEITMPESKSWLVRATENVTVAPRCGQIVLGRLESERVQNFPTLVCVEPAQIPIEGVLSARGLSRVESKAIEVSERRRRTITL